MFLYDICPVLLGVTIAIALSYRSKWKDALKTLKAREEEMTEIKWNAMHKDLSIYDLNKLIKPEPVPKQKNIAAKLFDKLTENAEEIPSEAVTMDETKDI